MDKKTVTMESGPENRKLSWGENTNGTVYVSERSAGDLTEFSYDAAERELTLTFEPSERYGLADVADRVERFPGNCFIHDFEDALIFWGIQYTRDERLVPLPA